MVPVAQCTFEYRRTTAGAVRQLFFLRLLHIPSTAAPHIDRNLTAMLVSNAIAFDGSRWTLDIASGTL
jgi:hypothetical protein